MFLFFCIQQLVGHLGILMIWHKGDIGGEGMEFSFVGRCKMQSDAEDL